MSDLTDVARDVAEALRDVGVETSVTVYTKTVDKERSQVTYSDPQTFTVLASPLAPWRESMRAPTNVRQGDAVTYIAGEGLPLVPQIGQRWQIHDRAFEVIDVSTYYSGSLVAAAYRLMLRGGAPVATP